MPSDQAEEKWPCQSSHAASPEMLSRFESLLDNDVLAPHVCRSAGKTPRPGAADIDEP
jgi:hypothetical protein